MLALGEIRLQTERLTLPHPELAARRFVLEPLLEVMTAVNEQRVERVGEL